jgi:cell division septum initiation protein DivIVA
LYEEPERPNQPLDYVRRYLGAPAAVDVEGLQRENEQLKRENAQLKQQVAASKNSSKKTLSPPE